MSLTLHKRTPIQKNKTMLVIRNYKKAYIMTITDQEGVKSSRTIQISSFELSSSLKILLFLKIQMSHRSMRNYVKLLLDQENKWP